MKDYKKPVEALRHCVSDEKGVTKCAGCPYYPDITGCMDRLHADAAAAIEELQAEMKQAAKRNGQLHAELEKWVSAAEELQDTVQAQDKALKMCAEQLAKSAPKHGEWIRNDNGTYSCSLCQSWIPDEQHYYAEYCLYCGAKMGV